MVLSRENYKYKRMYTGDKECVHIYQTEDNTTLNKVAALITWYGLGGEFSNMWYSIYAFLRDNKEYIDNDEMSSL